MKYVPRDMKQSELAARTGIPESTLSRYLHPKKATGRYRGTPAHALLAIAQALGVPVSDLYGDTERLDRREESIAERATRLLGDDVHAIDERLIRAVIQWIKEERKRLDT